MTDSEFRIRESGGGVEVAMHVQPRARRSEIVGLYNGTLRLKVSAPPVDDAANLAIIQFFAGLLKVSRARIKIVSGRRSRQKTIRIDGMNAGEFLSRLNLDQL